MAHAWEDDFEGLYEQYAPRLRAFAYRRLGDRYLAEDIAQETLLRAYTRAEDLDPSRDAWPWLVKVAANLCIDVLRRAREVATGLDTQTITQRDPASGDVHEQLMSKRRAETLAAAFRSIPSRQRRLLAMKELEGRSYASIASQHGMTHEAVRSVLARARRAFRDAYRTLADRQGLGTALAPLAAIARRVRRRREELLAHAQPLQSGAAQLVAAAALLGAAVVAVASSHGSDAGHPRPAQVNVAPASGAGQESPRPTAEPRRNEGPGSELSLRLSPPDGAPANRSAAVELDVERTPTGRSVIAKARARLPDDGAGAWNNGGADMSCDASAAAKTGCDAMDAIP